MDPLAIERVAVSNFKSFDDMEIRLEKLNVVIGANATGKSNFVNIFKFLRDIFTNGLDNAIAIQGGVDSVRNLNIGSSKDLKVELSVRAKDKNPLVPVVIRRGRKKISCACDLQSMTYGFSMEFFKRKRGYVVREEKLECIFNLVEAIKKKGEFEGGKQLKKCRILLTLDKAGKFEFHYEPRAFPIRFEEIFPFLRFKKKIPQMRIRRPLKELSLLGPSIGSSAPVVQTLTLFSPFSSRLHNFITRFALYDIDPKLSRRSTLITGKTELDSDGSNIAGVLKNILSTKKNRRRLASLMKDVLPFIEDLSVEKLADRSLLACLKEIYSPGKYLPAPLISDGTMNLTALIIALYFEKNPLTVIEEPERNIHPRLISKLIDMMTDVSNKRTKQIIITTHNPEVVRSAGIENLILIYRDKDFSRMSKPAEKKRVRDFLRNDIGVDELFVKNLLGE